MLAFFDGYKTKILAAITLLGAFLIDMGWISVANWEAVMKYIIPLLALAIHHAITRASKKATAAIEDVKVDVAQVENKVAAVAPTVARVVAAEVKTEVTAAVQGAAGSFPHGSRP